MCEIVQDHIDAIHLKSSDAAERLKRDVFTECQELKDFLATIPKNVELRPEYEDRVVSVGEKLSARFLTALLEDRGLGSQYVDLSDIIDFDIPAAKLNQEFYRNLSQAIGKRIRLCGDRIPVLTGFFGRVPNGLLATCGRGYSDLCAALAAVGSGAVELQVWKEVSGIYSGLVIVPTCHFSHNSAR